jgi:tRNA threonylcarbamoyladenosine biosynthesis protein TsaB
MGPLLAIETSAASGGIALLLPDGRMLERALGEGTTHGRSLLPAVSEVVGEAGLSAGEIGAVAVSAGPGSYTGLRVGVTAAKTLAWAVGCDLVAVSTLEALARDAARAAPPRARRLVPAIDARRGEVYAGFFAGGDGRAGRLSPDEALPPEELSRRLRAGDHVFGTATAAYPGRLVLPEGATSADGPVSPRAATIAGMGKELLSRGERSDVHPLAPIYLRPSEAEIRLEARKTKGRLPDAG